MNVHHENVEHNKMGIVSKTILYFKNIKRLDNKSSHYKKKN